MIDSGELLWLAYECHNPDCPGKKEGNQPFLFTSPDPNISIDAEGELVFPEYATHEEWVEAVTAAGGHIQPTCPACLPNRDLENESEEDSLKYANWVRPHILPETARLLAELDAEKERRLEELEQRRKGKPSG